MRPPLTRVVLACLYYLIVLRDYYTIALFCYYLIMLYYYYLIASSKHQQPILHQSSDLQLSDSSLQLGMSWHDCSVES